MIIGKTRFISNSPFFRSTQTIFRTSESVSDLGMIRSNECVLINLNLLEYVIFFNFVKMVGFGPHLYVYQKFCWIIKIINKIFWALLLLCSWCIYHVMCVGVQGHVIVLNADSLSKTFPLSEHLFAKSSAAWVFWFWTVSGFCLMYSM